PRKVVLTGAAQYAFEDARASGQLIDQATRDRISQLGLPWTNIATLANKVYTNITLTYTRDDGRKRVLHLGTQAKLYSAARPLPRAARDLQTEEQLAASKNWGLSSPTLIHNVLKTI